MSMLNKDMSFHYLILDYASSIIFQRPGATVNLIPLMGMGLSCPALVRELGEAGGQGLR